MISSTCCTVPYRTYLGHHVYRISRRHSRRARARCRCVGSRAAVGRRPRARVTAHLVAQAPEEMTDDGSNHRGCPIVPGALRGLAWRRDKCAAATVPVRRARTHHAWIHRICDRCNIQRVRSSAASGIRLIFRSFSTANAEYFYYDNFDLQTNRVAMGSCQ